MGRRKDGSSTRTATPWAAAVAGRNRKSRKSFFILTSCRRSTGGKVFAFLYFLNNKTNFANLSRSPKTQVFS
jgi:hypothetical protein